MEAVHFMPWYGTLCMTKFSEIDWMNHTLKIDERNAHASGIMKYCNPNSAWGNAST